ncbi:unnamed protein product [Protopolystoma xenopodis]|uniref:Uncharacterized protein n=1 Tax=Protopolystoma xenopodis TaxID=117903 RepID=A0A448XT10_9PLAT|nr:unnamed protein product [Protopolystoma xenopodis]
MSNGFGLHYLHRFLGLPFLALQRAILLRQLASNRDQLHTLQTNLVDAEELLDPTTQPNAKVAIDSQPVNEEDIFCRNDNSIVGASRQLNEPKLDNGSFEPFGNIGPPGLCDYEG